MSFLDKPPWYAAGLAFECGQCGRCCAGPEEGYVWVTDQEIREIAQALRITEQQMRSTYVRRVGRRQSLKESRGSNDCIFLAPNDKGGKGCRIYDVRPRQCRTWPFWPGNLRHPDNWAYAQRRCPGVNKGALHFLDEIEAKRKSTAE